MDDGADARSRSPVSIGSSSLSYTRSLRTTRRCLSRSLSLRSSALDHSLASRFPPQQSDWDKPTVIGYGQKRATVAKGSALNGESELEEGKKGT